jgi:integrase
MAGGVYPYLLTDGSERFSVMYRASNGVQRRKRGFTSPREAERFLRTTMAAVYRGEIVATRDTFAQYIDRWLEDQRPRLEGSTFSDYEVNVRKRLKPFFGEHRLTAITPQLIRSYVGQLASAGKLSPKTINNSIGVLSVALGHAEEDGLIARNPVSTRRGARTRIKLPAAHVEMDYLRLHEIPRYLDGCTDHYRPIAEFLIATGLRISEALALTCADIDWDSQTVRVVRSQKQAGLGSTKGDRSRSVDFGPRLQRVLADHQARRTEHGPSDLSAEPLFLLPDGERPNRRQISRGEHKDALRASGLRTRLRLHDLRHTAAASWLAAGLPMIYVQRQLGHSMISTTLEQYGHLEETFLRDGARRAEAAIWKARTPQRNPR